MLWFVCRVYFFDPDLDNLPSEFRNSEFASLGLELVQREMNFTMPYGAGSSSMVQTAEPPLCRCSYLEQA